MISTCILILKCSYSDAKVKVVSCFSESVLNYVVNLKQLMMMDGVNMNIEVLIMKEHGSLGRYLETCIRLNNNNFIKTCALKPERQVIA